MSEIVTTIGACVAAVVTSCLLIAAVACALKLDQLNNTPQPPGDEPQ